MSDLLFNLTIFLSIVCAIITIIYFILYVRARLAHRGDEIGLTEEEKERRRLVNAELDRKEKRYQSIHFISLFLFVVLGVLILVIMSNRQTVSY